MQRIHRQATTSLVQARADILQEMARIQSTALLVQARICSTTALVIKLQEATIRHTMGLVIMPQGAKLKHTYKLVSGVK